MVPPLQQDAPPVPSPAETQSPTAASRLGLLHHRLSVEDICDHPGDGPPAAGKEGQAFVNTTKFAFLMERRESLVAAGVQAQSPVSVPPAVQPEKPAPVREPKRCKTLPAQRLSNADADHAQGPTGLVICKHYKGGPEQLYDLDAKIGEGTFGSVRKATHKESRQVHVVKSIPKKLVPEAELWAEIDMLKHLDHPHIMRLYYTFEERKYLHIASEMCSGGELFDAILSAQVLTESIAARLFKQCLSAVSYLHFNSICHRDLKPENFLLSRKSDLTSAKVKLIDFGTAKRYDLGPMVTKVCTVSYVAPEVLKRSCDPYTEKIDVWSCGVMLYVMLSGHSPWNSTEDMQILKLVKKGKYTFEPTSVWEKVSDSAQRLIRRMMCMKVQDRCTAMVALHDSWVQENSTTRKSFAAKIDEEVLSQMRSFVGSNKLKKLALQVIARSISDDSIDKLRQIFMNFDKDMSGTLSTDEIEEALQALNAPESVVLEMQRTLCQMDLDSSGDIHWTEFLASTMKAQQYMQEEALRAAFHMMDADGDGVISKSDIASLLTDEDRKHEAGLLSVGSDQVDKIMESVDENGDGALNFSEFTAMMRDRRA